MDITYASLNEMSAAAVRKATGKTWDDWYAVLDAAGGAAEGRKALGELLLKQHSVEAWWVTTILVEYEKARGVVEKDGRPKGYNICVTKAIKSTPAAVFDAFSTKNFAGWMGRGARIDFREGGTIESGAGPAGTIKKLTPDKLIRFTWEGPRHAPGESVEVKLQPSGAKCSVILTHDRIQARDVADGLRAAWGQALDTLKTRLEK